MLSEHGLLITNTVVRLSIPIRISWMHPLSKHWHLIDYAIVRTKYRQCVRVTTTRLLDRSQNVSILKPDVTTKATRGTDRRRIWSPRTSVDSYHCSASAAEARSPTALVDFTGTEKCLIGRVRHIGATVGLKVSSGQSVKSGVPQGSLLGPVLFLIFINDMPLQLQTDTDIYADDTITHTAGKKTGSD